MMIAFLLDANGFPVFGGFIPGFRVFFLKGFGELVETRMSFP